ncbi:MAG: tetratricopeptide repeat protein [Gammaproteobacteria bacterium]|nr:tetratricopeptide repeat protein [Gammaproteobacteria bacterium]
MNKFFVILVFVILLISGCGGADSRKAKYLQSGNEHYSHDDCKKASLDYKNVLQIDPKDVDGLVGYARCLIEEKEWRKAYQSLLSAIESDPNSVNAKLELSKVYLISGDGDKSYQLIEEVLVTDPKNATAIALRGIFHLKNSTLTAARTDSQQAISLEGDNLSAITLLSSLYVKEGKAADAAKYISSIISKNEIDKRKKKELQIILIALYGHLDDLDNVTLIYKSLIAQYPKNKNYVYRLAAIYARYDNIVEAENLLLSSIDPDDSDSQLAYISFLNTFKSPLEATDKLEEFIEEFKDNGRLKLTLGKRYLNNDEIDKAKLLLTQLSEDISVVEHIEAKNELAFLLLRENKPAEAKNLVQQVLSEQPNNIRALVLRGTMAISNRDAPQAISDFRTILRDQPNNTFAIRQLATAYILNDQEELAKELLQKAIDIDSNDKELGLLYARLQGKDNEFESAITTVNDLLESNNDDIDTIKTLFDLQIANKDYEGAKQTAESMKYTLEDNPLGYYLSGILLQNENDSTAAEKEFLTALEKQPRANEPLSGLVRLYLSNGNQDKAITLLNNIINDDPDYLVPYNLLGEVGIAIKDYEMAIDSFKSAIEVNDKWWIPYRGLSITYTAKGDKDKAIQVLQDAFDKEVGVERLGIELALAQYREGLRSTSISTYEKIINDIPTSLLAKNNLAMILVDDQANQNDINKALVYIKDLVDLEEAASLDTVGWVYYKAGNFAKAIEILEKAVAMASNAAELHYHLGMAYSADGGDVEKAKEHLGIAAESEQNFDGKDKAVAKLNQL